MMSRAGVIVCAVMALAVAPTEGMIHDHVSLWVQGDTEPSEVMEPCYLVIEGISRAKGYSDSMVRLNSHMGMLSGFDNFDPGNPKATIRIEGQGSVTLPIEFVEEVSGAFYNEYLEQYPMRDRPQRYAPVTSSVVSSVGPGIAPPDQPTFASARPTQASAQPVQFNRQASAPPMQASRSPPPKNRTPPAVASPPPGVPEMSHEEQKRKAMEVARMLQRGQQPVARGQPGQPPAARGPPLRSLQVTDLNSDDDTVSNASGSSGASSKSSRSDDSVSNASSARSDDRGFPIGPEDLAPLSPEELQRREQEANARSQEAVKNLMNGRRRRKQTDREAEDRAKALEVSSRTVPVPVRGQAAIDEAKAKALACMANRDKRI